jgi:hypothetical protein
MLAVYEAEHLIDAHLVRGRLEAEGIPAHVQGEWLTGALGELPLGGVMRVCVASEHAEAARRLLAAWQAEAAPEPAPDADAADDLDLRRGALRA